MIRGPTVSDPTPNTITSDMRNSIQHSAARLAKLVHKCLVSRGLHCDSAASFTLSVHAQRLGILEGCCALLFMQPTVLASLTSKVLMQSLR